MLNQLGISAMLVCLFLPTVTHSVSTLEVKQEIIRQANFYNVSVNTALRIADCESKFNSEAKSPKSTAKGVYQFLDGTWKFVKAEGHPFDYKENIKQFMLTYPNKPQWWQCK